MKIDLNTVTARNKLKARRDPYWHKLGRSRHLGFRKMDARSDGTWCARFVDGNRKRHFQTFGTLDELPAHERFDQARQLAEEWFVHLDLGGSSAPKTVKDACEAYINRIKLDRNKSDSAWKDIERRFKTYVLNNQKLANTELSKLTKSMIKEWRLQHANTAIKMTNDKPIFRSDATLNRDMTPFRAALNLALESDWVTNDSAWRIPLRPVSKQENPDVEASREIYLSRAERLRLIENADQDLALFIKIMCMVPLRPSAIASLEVGHFNVKHSKLKVTVDKTGARTIVLPKSTAKFINEHCKSKLPKALIFPRADGAKWTKDKWKKPFKKAARAAGLPHEAVLYCIRHSVISDMVTNGTPLLTIAQIAGTSVRMIEKHYGKLLDQASISALEALNYE